jgi:hypothetical protein
MIWFLLGVLLGTNVGFLGALFVRISQDNGMDELYDAWEEIRRLRAQVAQHIGNAP